MEKLKTFRRYFWNNVFDRVERRDFYGVLIGGRWTNQYDGYATREEAKAAGMEELAEKLKAMRARIKRAKETQ